ncbi:MAG TPA: hypothetical protein VGW80_03055 [Solirubrobacterales bacterium]|jgi:uncharacterized delta-60 repeat protein|nr:hypothetical protein [Solirubrobacterales bacterium]
MLKRSIAISVLLALCGAAPAGAAFEVDRGFGVDGVVEGRFGNTYRPVAFRSLRPQPDGTVVPEREPAELDPGGKIAAVVPFKVEAVEPLPSGGALAGGALLINTQESGTVNMGLEVARLDSEAHLDPSFGEGGIVKLGSSSERLLGLFSREGGGVGAVLLEKPANYYGQAYVHPGSTIVELDAQGNSDPGFGNGGRITTPMAIEAFHLLEGGGLLVAGEKWGGPLPRIDTRKSDAFVGRFTPAGKPDQGFGGGDGLVSLDLGNVDLVGAAVWGADGSVTIGGSSTRWDGLDCFPFTSWCTEVPFVARFTAAGLPDPGFGSDGVVRLEGLSYAYARFEGGLGVLAMAPRPAGGVYAAGGSGAVAFVAALTAGGGLDLAYGSGGILTESEPIESSSEASAMAVDSRGRLLVSGETNSGVLDHLMESALFRYLPNGELDTSFGGGTGFVRLPEGGYGVAVGGRDSAFLLSGWSVTKILSSGRRDRSFGKGGSVELPSPMLRNERGRREETEVDLRSIAVLPHRRILVAGTVHKNESRAVVFRLRADGSLDRSFGHGGKAILAFGRTRQCGVEQMVLQPDGRIVLVGRVEGRRDDHPGKKLAVMRLLRNGSKDPSFGRKGLVVRRVGRRSYATAVAVQGRDLLVAGRARSGAQVKEVLLRLRPDGRPDRGFARHGIASALVPLKPGGYTIRARQILLSRGRILVLRDSRKRPLVTYSADGRARRDLRVARAAETANGSVRAPFGTLQGNRLVLGWEVFSAPARHFKLQRLRTDGRP